MPISTELPAVTAADLQPLAGEDQPTAVLRVVGATGGIAQVLRPNGRPGSVIITDAALIRQLLLRGSMEEEVSLIRNFSLRTSAPHGLISLVGAEHRKVRVAMAPCFRGAGLAPLQAALERRLEDGIAAWPTDVPVKAGDLMLDLLTRVFFEWVLGPQERAHEDELVKAQCALLEVFHHAVPDLNQLWPTPGEEGPVTFDDTVNRFFRLRTLISEAVERGPSGMMAELDRLLPPQGEGLPRSAQLTDHAIHLLLAGLDTVSQMSALLLHHLGQSEQAVDTLAAEASSGAAEPPFTEAVIKEIVRLYAGVPVAVRVSGAPIELRGCTIPTHRPIMAFLVCMQRDERSFERALEFLPERWLEGSTLRMDQAAYMPFGTGPHICIGETAAKLIMRRTIPAICRKFRVESCARGVVPVLIRIVALPLRPPQVVLRAR
jgi:cytochrome P450